MTAISKKRLIELNCVLGLDCSKYQKDINWASAKAAGIDFAFIKITEGTSYHEDNIYNVKARVLSAQENGVKVGYYHFARPGNLENPEQDAKEEIDNVISHINFLPEADLPFVLDIEAYATSVIWDKKIDHMNRFVSAFIAGLNAHGITTVFYSYKSFADTSMNPIFGKQPLWIAAYVSNPEVGLPKIPNGWSSWQIWQFTDKGRIEGYAGDLDLNVMKKDFFLRKIK